MLVVVVVDVVDDVVCSAVDAIVGVDDVPTAGEVGVNLGGGDDVVDVVAIDGGGGCGGVMACVRFVIDVVANLFRFVIDDDAAS